MELILLEWKFETEETVAVLFHLQHLIYFSILSWFYSFQGKYNSLSQRQVAGNDK